MSHLVIVTEKSPYTEGHFTLVNTLIKAVHTGSMASYQGRCGSLISLHDSGRSFDALIKAVHTGSMASYQGRCGSLISLHDSGRSFDN